MSQNVSGKHPQGAELVIDQGRGGSDEPGSCESVTVTHYSRGGGGSWYYEFPPDQIRPRQRLWQNDEVDANLHILLEAS